jgi:hypothetical protein
MAAAPTAVVGAFSRCRVATVNEKRSFHPRWVTAGGIIRHMTQARVEAPLGAAFARAVAAKDHARIRELLHPQLDFRAMTPRKVWEADGPDDVLAAIQVWFDDGDAIERIDAIETDRFANCERVGYRLMVRNDDGLHVVEQQAYISQKDSRIGWLRIMCSGYRRVD